MEAPAARGAPAALRDALRACRLAFVMVGVFSLAISLLMLVVPIYMMQVFDRVLATRNLDTLMALTVIAGFAVLVLGVLEAIRAMIMSRVGTWLDRALAPDVLGNVGLLAARGVAVIGAQGLRDLASVRNYLSGPAVFALFDAPFVPVFLAVVFFVHPLLGWVSVGGALALFALALTNELATRRPAAEANAQSARALNEADAAVRNADVIEALGMMSTLQARWRATSEQFLGHHAVASDRASAIGAAARGFRLLLQLTMLGVGAWLVTRNQLTGGAMIAASIIAGRAMAPVEQSINGWKVMIAAQAAYRRVRALLETDLDAAGSMTLPEPQGALTVEGLIYIPRGSTTPILRDVSFRLEPGTALGLIGPSAAGKTTLVRHLVGSLAPTRGSVRLDGADLTRWNASDRGRWLGYLPQNVELFAGTVRENIARMAPAAPDEEVVAAAQLAGAHDMILALPNGYDTVIGPGGGVLSGGQRQRIALARAVFGRPRLVVLDEPNASLDSEGEQALVVALGKLAERGTTVVLVAHRPSLMATMDKMLMLRAGAVAAFGNRDEVMGRVAAPGVTGTGGLAPAAVSLAGARREER
ncbi:MAG: type I secretion system permease/ATPase [Ectothiorhodospiraceae bacterium]|nr:type I secretion system permease/ATPase [Ectothiorhodospiraceae bacterium]